MAQREIKFRAWVKPLEEMAEVQRIDFDSREVFIKCINQSKDGTQKWYSFNDVELVEFTGLKDMLNKDIHEGSVYRDTIENEGQEDEYLYYICAYVKSQSAFCWVLNADYQLGFHELDVLPEDIEDYSTVCNYELHYIQTIGNIYEKPHLLTA